MPGMPGIGVGTTLAGVCTGGRALMSSSPSSWIATHPASSSAASSSGAERQQESR